LPTRERSAPCSGLSVPQTDSARNLSVTNRFTSRAVVPGGRLSRSVIVSARTRPAAGLTQESGGRQFEPRVHDAILNKTPLSRKSNQIIGGHAPSVYLEKIRTQFPPFFVGPRRDSRVTYDRSALPSR
jgi:hypothetical protein